MTNFLGSILLSTNVFMVTFATTNGLVQMERVIVEELRMERVVHESFRNPMLLPVTKTNSAPTNMVKTLKTK